MNNLMTGHAVQAFNPNEIVDAGKLKQIKATDSNPQFRVYSIAHEGIATPRFIGAGVRAVKFLVQAVQSVASKIGLGVQAFDGHNADNTTEGRKGIAEVVGSATRHIQGKLHSLACLYFPEKNGSQYDVISMESPRWHTDDHGQVYDIEPITGLALGRSSKDKPAFAGAKFLEAVQCFDQDAEQNQKQDKKQMNEHITVDQVKSAIKAHGWTPATLFDSNSMLGSINIGEDGKVSIDGGDNRLADIMAKKFKGKSVVPVEEVQRMQSAIQELEKIKPEYEKITRGRIIERAKTEIKKRAEERGLNEHRINFMLNDENLKSFEATEEDFGSKLEDYMHTKAELYKSLAPAFGATVDPEDPENIKLPESSKAEKSGTGYIDSLPDM